MFVPAIFLAVSILAIAVMVLFRVWEIRAGRISVREGDVPETFFSIDRMEVSTDEFFGKMRVISLHLLVYGVSHGIVILRRTLKALATEWSKIAVYLAKYLRRFPNFHNLPHRSPGSSVFLKDISAHKEEVRRENGYHEE